MVIFIDIDDTICDTPLRGDNNTEKDYEKSTPIQENIDKANRLYDEGNHIVYWTARGSVTGNDWNELTKMQLQKWGVKCHELRLGKPYYDLFIDDKNMNVEDWK